jgi:CheY-like chemotaxis protein
LLLDLLQTLLTAADAKVSTAFARAEDRQKALDAGFDRHVAKPVRPTDLLDVIERLLSS